MATGHHCGEEKTCQQLGSGRGHHHRTHTRLLVVTGREEEKPWVPIEANSLLAHPAAISRQCLPISLYSEMKSDTFVLRVEGIIRVVGMRSYLLLFFLDSSSCYRTYPNVSGRKVVDVAHVR